ncbi:hypothetical protein Tco_0917381, partial [Tanacetum coccineum]
MAMDLRWHGDGGGGVEMKMVVVLVIVTRWWIRRSLAGEIW